MSEPFYEYPEGIDWNENVLPPEHDPVFANGVCSVCDLPFGEHPTDADYAAEAEHEYLDELNRGYATDRR